MSRRILLLHSFTSLDTVLQFANITEKSYWSLRWYDVFCITACDRHLATSNFLITHFYGI